MEDNETSRDQVEQKHARGMSNKSRTSTESPSKRRCHPFQREETRENIPISPLRMPDLPHPTPPPMANIMMTSRIGYRRILSRGSEFRSPTLGGRSHSMDFGSRGPNMYDRDGRRSDFKCGEKNPQNYDNRCDMSQEFIDRTCRIKGRPLDVDHLKSEQPDCLRRSQTLDSRRPMFKEKRANTVEFMSPILTRAYLYHRDGGGDLYGANNGGGRHQATLTDQLGLSPLPRHKNIEYLAERLEEFNDYPIYPHLHHNKLPEDNLKPHQEHKSKYFSRDSVLSNELEEVRTLNSELQKKYIGENTEKNISRILESRSNSETSPEYYSVFFNEHYISDIDENEEIKEFVCGYKSPERRLSDQSERRLKKSTSSKNITDYYTQFQTTTLPSSFKTPSTKKCSKKSSNNTTSNVSAFAIHNSKQSILKSTNKCQFTTFGKNLDGAASSPAGFSVSSDNLTLNRASRSTQKPKRKCTPSRNTGISKSSDPISIPSAHHLDNSRLTTAFSNSSTILPISSAHSYQSSSVSSMKSSDYYSFVPLVTSSVKKVEFSGDSTGKVIKSPQRRVVKLAKIR